MAVHDTSITPEAGIENHSSMFSSFIEFMFEKDDLVYTLLKPDNDSSEYPKPAVMRRDEVLDMYGDFKNQNDSGMHVFFGINRRIGLVPGNEGVKEGRILVADYDKPADGPASEVDFREILKASKLPTPSMFVRSGGGFHAYWKLKEHVSGENWKAGQKYLIEKLGTDNIHDLNRSIRVPGFKNLKYPNTPMCEIVELDASLVYDFKDVVPAQSTPSPSNVNTRPISNQEAAKRNGAILDNLDLPAKSKTLVKNLLKWAQKEWAEGKRNNTWFKLACQLRDNRIDQDSAERLIPWLLSKLNTDETHPFTYEEALTTLKSAYSHEPREPFSVEELSTCTMTDEIFDRIYSFNKEYLWMPLNSQDFIEISSRDIKAHLRRFGFSEKKKDGGNSEMDEFLTDVRERHTVAWAGPIAGKKVGIYHERDKMILVTTSPKMIPSVAGKWPLIKQILEGMFLNPNDPGDESQLPHFYGWLKVAYQAVLAGEHQPGQVLGLSGPPESGKTLLIQIICEVLGGRDPGSVHKCLMGTNNFNIEHLGKEVLVVDDAASTSKADERAEFAAAIKNYLFAARPISFNGKFKDAIYASPAWRMIIATNLNPEALSVLPLVKEDIADKSMYLRVFKAQMPMPTTDAAGMKAFWNAIRAELPAFVHFVANFEIPPDLKANRTGIRSFHHPEIVNLLENDRSETYDQDLILECCPAGWDGTANQLLTRLNACTEHSFAAKRISQNSNKVGHLLNEMAKTHPSRVKLLGQGSQSNGAKGVNRYRITGADNHSGQPKDPLYARSYPQA